jgi:hypothetical protein
MCLRLTRTDLAEPRFPPYPACRLRVRLGLHNTTLPLRREDEQAVGQVVEAFVY